MRPSGRACGEKRTSCRRSPLHFLPPKRRRIPSGSSARYRSIRGDSRKLRRQSSVRPIPCAVSPPFDVLGGLNRVTPAGKQVRAWQDAVTRVVDVIAGLTAVDGATVMTANYDLLAFGAKIARKKGSPQVEVV